MTDSRDWQVVCLSDVPPTPWRNGGGTTRELLAWPRADDWLWRVSVADVVQSGPFSSFTGVQRWFAVLQGDGVCLTVDGNTTTLQHGDAPFAFNGGAATDCELLGGPTQDFNFMLKGQASGRMLRVSQGFEMVIKTPKIIAAYAYQSGASVQFLHKKFPLNAYELGWVRVAGQTAVRVDDGNVLLMEIDT